MEIYQLRGQRNLISVRNKAIKERIKERKIDTENLTWFGYNVYAYVHDYTRKYLYFFWCVLKLYIESLI